MLSRALSLAAVTLLIGCLTAAAVRAVENLEAGKSPAQIFAGTCNACHKSPRGLLRSVPASSLSGFLRQHYTTSSDMASVLSSYLVSNGATDTRAQPKEAKGKDGAKDGTKEAARAPADQPGAKQQSRLPQPGETIDPMRPDLVRPGGPTQAAVDPKQKQKQGKKGQEPARTEPAEPPKETAKGDEGAKPATESPKPKSATIGESGAVQGQRERTRKHAARSGSCRHARARNGCGCAIKHTVDRAWPGAGSVDGADRPTGFAGAGAARAAEGSRGSGGGRGARIAAGAAGRPADRADLAITSRGQARQLSQMQSPADAAGLCV